MTGPSVLLDLDLIVLVNVCCPAVMTCYDMPGGHAGQTPHRLSMVCRTALFKVIRVDQSLEMS